LRRLLGAALTLALLVPALAVLAGGSANYKDSFDGGNYSGNEGSLDFDGPWTEFGDGSGSPSSGRVHIDSSGPSGGHVAIDGGVLGVAAYGLQRAADLGSLQSVELSFDIEVEPDLLGALLNTANLQVQVFDGSWVTVKSFYLRQATSQHVVIDVTDYANADFMVRFMIPEVSLVYTGTTTIDEVELSGTLVVTTTTTSTSTTTSTTQDGPTTTSTSSTTSTTRPGGTGGGPTTTSGPTSPTTSPSLTTTTPAAGGGGGSDDDATGATTTTTISGTTSTTTGDGPAVGGAGGIPPGSGLRQAGVGLIADFETGMMGDVGMGRVEVLGAELEADFSLAVEAFEKTRVWIGVLALVMATAVVSGMDRRRSRRQAAESVA
jgi:hypothetical protein